jgi:hypothetical protein
MLKFFLKFSENKKNISHTWTTIWLYERMLWCFMDRNTLTMPYKPIVNPFVGGESLSNDAILDCTQKSHMIANNTHRKGVGRYGSVNC